MNERATATESEYQPAPADMLALVTARRGHFAMESGYHSDLWLDLDSLFADAARIEPFIRALARSISLYHVDVVCGPLVGGAFLAQSLAARLGVEFWYTERVDDRDGEKLFAARYQLPAAFRSRLPNPRVAIVDDVMSAGSSLRATYTELRSMGGNVVVAGALLVMGPIGRQYFERLHIPVEAVASDKFETWAPDACPLCVSQIPLERVVNP